MPEQNITNDGLNCPTCRVTLTMTERQGIEIDYCPKCRGIWLDRGELDKIIERSGAIEGDRGDDGNTTKSAGPRPSYPPQPQYQDQGHGQYGGGYGHHGSRRRKSWLSEIFD